MGDSGEFLIGAFVAGGDTGPHFPNLPFAFLEALGDSKHSRANNRGNCSCGDLIVLLAGLTWQALGGLPQWIIIAGAILVIPSIIVFLVGVFYLSQGAMIHAVSSIYLGRKIIVKEAYRFVMGKLGKFVSPRFLSRSRHLRSLLSLCCLVLQHISPLAFSPQDGGPR